MRSKTRFVVKYVSFAELSEKKKKSSKRSRISNDGSITTCQKIEKRWKWRMNVFFFFKRICVSIFFSNVFFPFFSLSFFIYIYHVGQNFKHEGERNEAIVVWVFKDVTPAKMSIIDVRNDTGVDDKWHQRRLFRSFELLTSAAFMHGKKC